MKLEMVQTACPTSGVAPINYDIHSVGGASSPVNDMIGAMFLCDAGTGNDVSAASNRWGFGATDLVNNFCITMGAQDATAGAGIRSILSVSKCITTSNGVGALTDPQGSFGSSLSDGIRLSVSPTPSVARLTDSVLFSGADHAIKVGNQYFASGTTDGAQTHGLGGTPDVIILVGSIDVPSSTNEVDGKGFFIGFWDRESGNFSSQSMHVTTAANPTDIAQYISNASIGEIINAAGTPAAHVTLTAIGGTTFNIHFSASGGVNVNMAWVALRGTSQQMFSKNTVASLPTSTGIASLISGISGKPQFCMVLPTRTTSINAGDTTDGAGSFGCGLGVTTDGTTTFQGSNPNSFKDNVASSVAEHGISFARGLWLLDNTGANLAVAPVSSWDSGGASHNFTTAPASAFKCPVLAFGLPLSSGSASAGRNLLMGVG